MRRVRHCWNWGIMAFTYRDMGHAFHEHFLCIFRYGWMDCRDAFHAVFCLLILLCNGQNIAKYKPFWLIDVPIIYPCGLHQPSFLVAICQNYYVSKKLNKHAWGKICNFTGNRDHIDKKWRKRVVAYICRYSSGQLIPIFLSVVVAELGINSFKH